MHEKEREAFRNGKRVQYQYCHFGTTWAWYTTSSPNFECQGVNWRIHPDDDKEHDSMTGREKLEENLKKEVERKISIMQAYANGKNIETCRRVHGLEWNKVNSPAWDWHIWDYRIAHTRQEETVNLRGGPIKLNVERDGKNNVVSVSLVKE